METRAQQFADAYELVALSDHYMVGVVEPATDTELAAAEQILITRQNSKPAGSSAYKRLETALDLIQMAQHNILVGA
jgi:hypothetical protein